MRRSERILKDSPLTHSGDCATNFMCLSCQKFLLGYQAAIDELRSEEARQHLYDTCDYEWAPSSCEQWATWLERDNA